ncbi:DNA polymerase III subunit delta [Cytophagaceae bacterium ABcell3]|nr:DNA polymerase III subunit delta [Cytophagaceae bacterium ABcell3]
MANNAEAVLKDLKAGKYAPVYFLQGDESYYIDLISGYIEKNCLSESEKGFNQTVLYGKDVQMNVIMQHARKFPMMSERQVVIVKEAQDISDLGKEAGDKLLEAYLKNPLPSTILVFCHKNKTLDARKGIAKKIKDHAILIDSKKLYDNKLPDWVNTYFTNKGYKVNPKVTVMLSDFIGNDLNRLANEIDKLLINLKEGQQVNEELVEKYVGISKEYNVFELQKALAYKDVLKANRIINYFEANPKNNPLIPVIAVLYSFFSKTFLVHTAASKSESNLAKLLQVNPFFVKDYLAASKSYPAGKARNIIHYIREADLQVKGITGGGTSEGQILRELVFKILH